MFDTPIVNGPMSLGEDDSEKSRSSALNEVVWLGRRGDEEDAIDVCSPPLWKTSNTHQNLIKYNQLSPAAKARAVARAQQELMEMVDKMPESSYELSLKDIVEHNRCQRVEPHKLYNNKNPFSHFDKEELSKRKSYGIMKRSGSVDNGGFLLKMILPFDFTSSSKKQTVLNESKQGCSKVSPRPSSVGTSDGPSWFGDNESIRRNSKGDSRRVVSRSNSRKYGGIFHTGCWSVLSFKKKVFED